MLRSSTYDPDLRRRRLIVLAILTGLLLISATTYALLARTDRHTAPPDTSDRLTAPQQATGPNSVPDDGTLPELPPVTDPAEFAEVVAHAIFDWDTTGLAPRAAYLERIATIADPTGEESPGLISDVDAYLPRRPLGSNCANTKPVSGSRSSLSRCRPSGPPRSNRAAQRLLRALRRTRSAASATATASGTANLSPAATT